MTDARRTDPSAVAWKVYCSFAGRLVARNGRLFERLTDSQWVVDRLDIECRIADVVGWGAVTADLTDAVTGRLFSLATPEEVGA